MSREGIVAAESPLAAQAGAQILFSGGHAIDAAIAANAVMGVLAPHSNGLGGDLFAIVYEASTRRLYGLNASGWSPAALTIDWLRKRGIEQTTLSGVHSVTIPGVVDGWDKLLRRFGRLQFRDLLAYAVHYAREGFPVTEWSSQRWSASEGTLRDDPSAVRTFLPDGHAPHRGEIFRNPDLAKSLEEIAQHGRDAFYRGPIAECILRCTRRLGAALEAEDFSEFNSEWVDPISTEYRGWSVYEIPPNGAGIAALLMLNIMEAFPLRQWGHNHADSLHLLIEAKKLAYADMLQYVADPRAARVPMTELLSKVYAGRRGATIDFRHANSGPQPGQLDVPGANTTYLSAVDAEGNLVSLIQSNFALFGVGLVPDGTGFALQNRGHLFSLDEKHPNALEGRKRPLHTIIPGFMSKGDVRIAFGIMGGWNQSQAHAQFVSNIVDHDMNIQSALEAPRFTKPTFAGVDVQMESRIAAEVRSELTQRGHDIEVLGTFSDVVGGGQAVLRDEAQRANWGASDPRKDGAAIPQPPLLQSGPGSLP